MTPNTSIDAFYGAILKILPKATLSEDNDGQIIINTNLKESNISGYLMDMDDNSESVE